MKRVLLIGAVLFVLTASACEDAATVSTPVPGTPPQQPMPKVVPNTTQPAAIATITNPLDTVSKAFRSLAAIKSYHVKITTPSGTSVAQELMVEVVTPDRYHLIGKDLDAIVIGNASYLKRGDQWIKAALPKELDWSFADVRRYDAELKIATDVKFRAPEILNGTPTLVYQYNTMITTPAPSTYASKHWIGVADGLPRKYESTSKTGVKTAVVGQSHLNQREP